SPALPAIAASVLAGCSHKYVGSGYATSTKSVLDPIVAYATQISWKRELTMGDLAAACAALVAAAALWLAWHQLRALNRQTRATVLLSLDQRWESQDVIDLREELESLIRKVEREAGRQSTEGVAVSPADLFPERLERLRVEEPERYFKLFRL